MNEEPRSLDLAMNERAMLRELIESSGWQFLMTIAQAQRQVRSNKILLTPRPADEITVQEFEKGEVAGIMLFEELPTTAIEALSAEIDEWKRKLNLDEGETDGHASSGNAP